MYKKGTRGFTLIELLVVIAIIGVLSSVVLASLNTARAKGRDAKRVSDLQQLELALELYYDENLRYPREVGDSANGKIGEGSGLDTILLPYISATPVDPLGPGSSYYYYYDGRHSCGGYPGGLISVIFARNMETIPSNASSLCTSWGGEGGGGQPGTWHIILGESDG